MTKREFLSQLREALHGLPQKDLEERLLFYAEMIDDRMEDGLTEEDAVLGIGSVEDVAAQIVSEIPLARLVREKAKPKRSVKAWEVVLLVLGSPIWLPLLLAAVIVAIAVWVVLWSLIVVLWAIDLSLAAALLAGVIAGAVLALQGSVLAGVAMLGAGALCGGLSIFLFFGCTAAMKGIFSLMKRMAFGIRSQFVGKEKM